ELYVKSLINSALILEFAITSLTGFSFNSYSVTSFNEIKGLNCSVIEGIFVGMIAFCTILSYFQSLSSQILDLIYSAELDEYSFVSPVFVFLYTNILS